MATHDCVRLTERVALEAGPTILRGSAHEAGANRVRLDVSAALEKVPFRVDQRRPEATLPQCPRTSVPIVEMAHVGGPECLHHAGWRARVACGDEQVDVVRHQDVGMNRAACLLARVEKRQQITRAVEVVDKAGAAVVAALNEMKCVARKDDTQGTRHLRLMRRSRIRFATERTHTGPVFKESDPFGVERTRVGSVFKESDPNRPNRLIARRGRHPFRASEP